MTFVICPDKCGKLKIFDLHSSEIPTNVNAPIEENNLLIYPAGLPCMGIEVSSNEFCNDCGNPGYEALDCSDIDIDPECLL